MNDYLDESDLHSYFTKDSIITDLKRKLQIKYVMLTQAKEAAKKANKEKLRTVTLLLSLRDEGALKMTDLEISDRCFVTKRSVIEANSRLKRAAK